MDFCYVIRNNCSFCETRAFSVIGVCAFLKDHYNNKWIDRSGPVVWPPCSPDITSPDFYLWRYLKNVVSTQRPTTRQDLMELIHRACAAIPRATLLNNVHNFERRLNFCLEANGGNFEKLRHG